MKLLKESSTSKVSLIEENSEPKSIIKEFFDESLLKKEIRISQALSSSVPYKKDGNSLKFPFLQSIEKLVNAPTPEPLALDIMRQCVGLIADLESNQFVHRDIKPGNLFLDAQSRLYLSDFETAQEPGSQSETTCGTPGFMAPEQYTNSRVDWLADQYSFGCVLYFVLTGIYPFKAERKEEFLEIQISGSPDPSTVNSKLKKPFCDLIIKMMSPVKEDRYQTIEEIFHAVDACSASTVKIEIIENKIVKIEPKALKQKRKNTALILYILAALIFSALAFKIL